MPADDTVTTAATLRTGLGALVTGLQRVAAAADVGGIVAPLLAECARPPGADGAGRRRRRAPSAARVRSSTRVLDRPGLVPVDSDVATGVHIAVRHGDIERARVHVAGTEPIVIDLADVERYASERHNPGNALDVSAVEIEMPAPLLAGGLELVDTPGVDSIVARHADVTLAALALADALVLVVDPGRPLTAPELAFLGEADPARRPRRLRADEAGPAPGVATGARRRPRPHRDPRTALRPRALRPRLRPADGRGVGRPTAGT